MRFLPMRNARVSALSLGCMGMSHAYSGRDEAESIAVIREALDSGINFLDSAEFYGAGANEELIGRAIRGRRDAVLLSTKFGLKKGPRGLEADLSPQAMRKGLEGSLRRLGVDHIDLWHAHRLDPAIPVEETVGQMARFVEEGKVRYLGLSEVSAAALGRACAVHPVAALQSELSLLTQDALAETLAACARLGVRFFAFAPLCRGLLAEGFDAAALPPGDCRLDFPRFFGPGWEACSAIRDKLGVFAKDHGMSLARLALAWVLSRPGAPVALVGTGRLAHLREDLLALEDSEGFKDWEALDAMLRSLPAPGPRYNDELEGLVLR
jgi:aryl-alcohol dehydrogenase-like predicted oxidoreductase